MKWVVTMIVTPFLERPLMWVQNSRRVMGSTPEVGSSRNSTGGRCISAQASALTTLTGRVGTAEGNITTLQSTKVDAAGAVSAINAQIAAEYGSIGAMAEATALAEATADGLATAGYVFRARAGGAVGEVELVAASDPVGGASSLFRVSADRLVFEGGLTEFFGTVEITGDLIVAGTITSTQIADGAVSDTWRTDANGPWGPYSSTGILAVATLNIGAVARGSIIHRGVSFEARVQNETGVSEALVVELQRRSRQLGGAFTASSTIKSWTISSTAWDVYSDSGNLTGSYDEFEYRLGYRTNYSGALDVLRNITLVAKNIVK